MRSNSSHTAFICARLCATTVSSSRSASCSQRATISSIACRASTANTGSDTDGGSVWRARDANSW